MAEEDNTQRQQETEQPASGPFAEGKILTEADAPAAGGTPQDQNIEDGNDISFDDFKTPSVEPAPSVSKEENADETHTNQNQQTKEKPAQQPSVDDNTQQDTQQQETQQEFDLPDLDITTPPGDTQSQQTEPNYLKTFEEKFAGKMSNDSREYVRARLKQLEETLPKLKKAEQDFLELQEKRIPDSFYEHPEAYQLTPDYKNLSNQFEVHNHEYNHWKSQLAALEKENKWVNMAWNGEAKQYQFSQPQDGSPEIKAQILARMQELSGAIQTTKSKATEFKEQFVSQAGKVKQFTTQLEDRFFSDLKEPKDPAVKKDIDAMNSQLPKTLQVNPLAPVLVKMYARVRQYQRAYQKLKATQSRAQDLNQEQRQAGPGKQDTLGETGSKPADRKIGDYFDDPETDLMGEFEKAKSSMFV